MSGPPELDRSWLETEDVRETPFPSRVQTDVPTPTQASGWWTPEVRADIYTVAMSVLALLVTLGVVDQATAASWGPLIQSILSIAGPAVGFLIALLAKRHVPIGSQAASPVPEDVGPMRHAGQPSGVQTNQKTE